MAQIANRRPKLQLAASHPTMIAAMIDDTSRTIGQDRRCGGPSDVASDTSNEASMIE